MEPVAEMGTLGYFWAGVLGMVQGVAEFLPVSSSGHLALVEHFGLGRTAPAIFDLSLHLATLIIVLAYFRRTILWYYKNNVRVLHYVCAASVATAMVGFVFKDEFMALRESPRVICLGLLLTSVALFVAAMYDRDCFSLPELGMFRALVVGFCQALAIVPGISRSGSTISCAVLCGLKREDAFGFSFIISIPTVLGATALHAALALKAEGWAGVFGGVAPGPFAIGFLFALVSGYLSLRFMHNVVKQGGLWGFAVYCYLAAMVGTVCLGLF